jgi:hypothetical protein
MHAEIAYAAWLKRNKPDADMGDQRLPSRATDPATRESRAG